MMEFDDLPPIEEPFTYRDKKYVLREANHGAAETWRNAILRATTWSPDGKVTKVDGMASTESLLVSLCVYAADAEGRIPLLSSGEPDHRALVPLATLKTWRNSVIKTLHYRIMEISALKEKEETEKELEEKLKKLRSATTEASV